MIWYKSALFKKTIGLLIVSIVFLFTFQLFINGQAKGIIEKNYYSSNGNIAISIKSTTSLYFSEIQRTMGFVSNLKEVKQLKLADLDSYLKQVVEDNPYINQMYIMNSEGQQIYKTSYEDTLGDRSDRDYFQAAIQGKYYISESLISRSTGEPIIVSAIPIYNGQKIIGVLGASINLENLNHNIQEIRIEDNGYAFMVDSQGTLIVHPRYEWVQEQKNVRELNVVQSVISGQSGNDIYWFEDTEKMAAYLPLGINQWGAVVQVPREEVYNQIKEGNQLMNLSYITFTLMLILLISGVFYVSIKPLNQTLQGIYQIDFFDEKAPYSHIDKDEYGFIQEVINEMHGKIYEVYKDLEAKVKERTEALDFANDALANKIEELTESQFELEASNDELKLTLEHLEQMQNRILEAQKLESLNRFSIRLAHEVNTPLGVIVSNQSYLKLKNQETLEKLEGGQLSKNELIKYLTTTQEILDSVESQTEKTLKLMNSFKALSESRGENEILEMSLDQVFKHLSEWFESSFPYADCSLKYAGGGVKIQTYEEVLEKVIKHLIQNAFDHGRIEGIPLTIELKASRENQETHIDIIDNGKGIADHVFDNLFEPLNKHQMGVETIGMGLTYSRILVVEILHGHIHIEKGREQGTQVRISLPLKIEEKSLE